MPITELVRIDIAAERVDLIDPRYLDEDDDGAFWEGLVSTGPLDIDEALERIYRLFNRVDEGDGERLERIGYRLPSLSVDDIVTLRDRRYRVASMGFEEVADDG